MSDTSAAPAAAPASAPEAPAAPPAGEPQGTPPASPPATGTEAPKDWQAEAEKWKALARKHEDRWKNEGAPAVERVSKIEAEQMTEAQRAEAAREAAEARAAALLQRTAKAEAKALASDFADPDDALVFLGDVTRFADEAGDINTEAMRAELSELLARKPHLAKGAALPTPPPPNPAQGGEKAPGGKGPTLSRADIAALAKKGDFDAIAKAQAEGRITYSKR